FRVTAIQMLSEQCAMNLMILTKEMTEVYTESASPSVVEPYPKRLINRISRWDVMEAEQIDQKGADVP
ncbi:MAG: hypothetical protein EZS28_046857, partial [Streblomastix strix]